jgi:hypothetical protein
VCKICTHTFVFSVAFVPAGGSLGHPTGHDRTRCGQQTSKLSFEPLRAFFDAVRLLHRCCHVCFARQSGAEVDNAGLPSSPCVDFGLIDERPFLPS